MRLSKDVRVGRTCPPRRDSIGEGEKAEGTEEQ